MWLLRTGSVMSSGTHLTGVWRAHRAAILSVMGAWAHVRVYSFVFQRSCSLFERRERYVLSYFPHSGLPRFLGLTGLMSYTPREKGGLPVTQTRP